MFRATLRAGGWARALNVLPGEELYMTRVLLRYADVAELDSYRGGTFESRREGGGRRGYKAFSMHANHFASKRPVTVRVPIDAGVRGAVALAAYTALPRPLPPSMERIGDGKHVAHAGETECRLPDGARVPPGTQVLVRRGSAPPEALRSLRQVADARFI